MKSWICTAAAAVLLATPAWAHGPDAGHSHQAAAPAAPAPATNAAKLDAHTQQDIERHLSMAKAHEQAAQCLSTGNKYEECQKQLQVACKGLALGKNCGMRHAH